jgi:outer membrane receptor protein involved in Fe transport
MQREERYDRDVLGMGLQLSGSAALAGAPLEWLLGTERLQEDTDYGYWEGTQNRQRMAAAVSDRRTALDTTAAYAQAHWKLAPWLQPSMGVRWDRFTGDCRRLGAETGSDTCERMATTRHASPKLGVTSQIAPQTTLRASWSEGFALASDFAKYALGTAGLDPNVFRQTELGVQWAPIAACGWIWPSTAPPPATKSATWRRACTRTLAARAAAGRNCRRTGRHCPTWSCNGVTAACTRA